jgi:hypothetical protein
LGGSANLLRIVRHFAGFSVAQITARDVLAVGFRIVRVPAEQLDEPHADLVPPANVSIARATKDARKLAKTAELIYVSIDAAHLALLGQA